MFKLFWDRFALINRHAPKFYYIVLVMKKFTINFTIVCFIMFTIGMSKMSNNSEVGFFDPTVWLYLFAASSIGMIFFTLMYLRMWIKLRKAASTANEDMSLLSTSYVRKWAANRKAESKDV